MPVAAYTLDHLQAQIAEQGTLSVANRAIAEFVAQHLRDVSLMSATELAEVCQVSQSSVSRFCMGLGFSGYADFVRALQDLVREEWQAPDRTRYLHVPSPTDPLVSEELTNLSGLSDILDSREGQALIQYVQRFPRLILAGARASATVIPYAHYFLSKIRDKVEIATPDSPLWTTLASHSQPDVAILAFVFPRYSRILVEWLEDVSKWATPVAAITDRPQSPVREWARPMVVVPVARSSLFDSYAGVMVFLNLLIRQAAALTPNIDERLQAIEQYETQHHVYR